MLNKKRPLKKSSTVLITQILGMITQIHYRDIIGVILFSSVKSEIVRVFRQSQKGLTLIETLIALVITLVLFMALMQSALLSIGINTGNVLRDEAVRIAEERMNDTRNIPFDLLLPDPNPMPVGADCPAAFPANGILIERDIRNISGFDFCTNRTVADRGVDNKEVLITVGWVWQDEDRTHNVLTLVRRP